MVIFSLLQAVMKKDIFGATDGGEALDTKNVNVRFTKIIWF